MRILHAAWVLVLVASTATAGEPADIGEIVERLTQECHGLAYIPYRVNVTAFSPATPDSGENKFLHDDDAGLFLFHGFLSNGERIYTMSGFFARGECLKDRFNGPPPDPMVYCIQTIPPCPLRYL